MSKTHTAKALAFCATPGLIIIAYSRLNHFYNLLLTAFIS